MLMMTQVGQTRDQSATPQLSPVTPPQLPTTITPPDITSQPPADQEYDLNPETGQYEPVAPKKKGLPWWGWLLIVLGAAGGIGLTIYFVGRR